MDMGESTREPTPHVRKHLAESLVLFKVSYACSVSLQRLQNACAGFVTRRFAGVEDVVKLNWLPVNKNVELNIRKLAHKSLYDETFNFLDILN